MRGRPDEAGHIFNAIQEARPDAIMHFAANALVGESMTNPRKYFHNNVVNGLKLLDAAIEAGEEVCIQFHLRHLRPARAPADDRGSAAAPHQPVWGIQVDVRESAFVSTSASTGWSSSLFGISTPPGPVNVSGSTIGSRRI